MDDYRGDEMLRTVEVAELLRMNPQTVRAWCRSGELRAIAMGGSRGYLVRVSDLRAMLHTREAKDNGKGQERIERSQVVGMGA